MNCQRLVCTCNCGGFGQPLSNWITDTGCLLIRAYCLSCEKIFNVLFPLADLQKASDPKALDEAIGKEIAKICKPQTPTAKEKLWLHQMGITFTCP